MTVGPPDDGRASWLARLRSWLDATPAETAGLAVLLTGALAATVLLWWGARPVSLAGPGPVAAPTLEGTPPGPVVHVSGAVERPGLVELPAGARVADALAAAGGSRPDAALEGINLARVVEDGEQLHVPSTAGAAAAPAAEGDPAAPVAPARLPDGRLDLNRASAAELEELPGIGPVLAERIVAWRDAEGPFTSVGQLREVSGIGERTFQRLAEVVAVR